MGINDNGIVETLKQSPENGFRMLMAKYQESVYWHIRRLVVSHDDAQDASQETFVRIYRSLGNYRGDCSLRGWIYRIATNEALRLIGKRKQEVVSMDSQQTGVNLIMADNYIDYDDLGFDEIAKIADSTPTSIKASYHVAKEKIIKFMNSND